MEQTKNIETELDFFNHSNYYIQVFKPDCDGERQKGTLYSGFGNKAQVLKIAKQFNGQGVVCVAINERPFGKTKKEDVQHVTVFFIDVDVHKQRKVKYVSTDQDHTYAINKAQKIKLYLKKQYGFGINLLIDSGNGAQLLSKVSIDISTLDKREDFIAKATAIETELANKFNDDIIKIDCVSKDVNRRIKLIGTINKKDTSQREDRVAQIVEQNVCDVEVNTKAIMGVLILAGENSAKVESVDFSEPKDDSGSGKDYRECIRLLFKYYDEPMCKQMVYKELDYLEHWKNERDQYKDRTYKAALKYVSVHKENKVTTQPQSVIKELTLKTYRDFENIKPDKNYLIEDYILPNSLIMVYSPPACFKSILVQYMVFCITTGKKWFGFKTKKFPVLVCDRENHETMIAERLNMIKKGLKVRNKDFPLYYLSRQEGDILNPNFIASLKKAITDYGIKLVVFDTLHRYGQYDENSANDVSKLYTTCFSPLIDEMGVSILFLHHTTKNVKNAGFRGSGDFEGQCDVTFSVVRYGKSNMFKIENVKHRRGELKPLEGVITFNEDTIHFETRTQQQKEEGINKLISLTNKVKHLFCSPSTELKTSDVIFSLEQEEYEFSKATLKRCLKWLVDQEFLVKTKTRGPYKRNFATNDKISTEETIEETPQQRVLSYLREKKEDVYIETLKEDCKLTDEHIDKLLVAGDIFQNKSGKVKLS
ncbi:MAG: AAA family ATPase [Nanoarchaeota archaeon]|nr:AAA family ATPase [Nanoarchaeota archaeon]